MRTSWWMAGAVALAPTVSLAQDAATNFSYSAPSGMFSEGTTKWQNYRFVEEDKERTARFNAGQDVTTGSIQGTAINDQQVRRPGERGSRRPNGR